MDISTEQKIEMKPQNKKSDFLWYAIRTMPKQELIVKRCIEQTLENAGFKDYIKTIFVPTKNVVEVKNGKKINSIRRFYPGYVFLCVKLYDENGIIFSDLLLFIRRTQSVLGFVGGEKPTVVRKNEIDDLMEQIEAVRDKKVMKVDYQVGDSVKVMDGPFIGLTGTVDEVDVEKCRLMISISVFGRFTPVDLEYWQVSKEK